MIQIHDLLIQRNGLDALRIHSLDIRRGETLTVVGPNGAGKSTLLLALARLIKLTSGEIIYEGKSLAQWDELDFRRKISFVFQSPLLMDMTVEQNVALGLKFRGTPRDEILEFVGKWMKQLGIESLAKRRAGTRKHHPVARFVPPDEFESLETIAYAKGFLMVSASPLTRSSHHAGEDFAQLKAARGAK